MRRNELDTMPILTRPAPSLARKREKRGDKDMQYAAMRRKTNPEAVRRAGREHMRRKRETPEGIVELRMRNRIKHAITRRNMAEKAGSTMELVGCTREELARYIESKFKPGMTWDNRAEWHIDHILPVSSFNLLDADEQRRCFHFSNLQPLWKEENLKMTNKLIYFHKAA